MRRSRRRSRIWTTSWLSCDERANEREEEEDDTMSSDKKASGKKPPKPAKTKTTKQLNASVVHVNGVGGSSRNARGKPAGKQGR